MICPFANGHGYIQHSLGKVNRTRASFHLFATNWLNDKSVEYINSEEWLKWHNVSERPMAIQKARATTYDKYFIGRYLDDSGSPLYKDWSRLQCIDEKGREWGQPYYALHPENGEQKQLN